MQKNVNCGEIIIFDRKFYFKNYKLSFKFYPRGGDFVKKFCPGGEVFERKI